MTSKTDATYQKSIILSKDDERLLDLKYKIEDKFWLRSHSIDWDEWETGLKSLLEAKKVVVQIDSYELTVDGEIAYRLSFVFPKYYTWYWQIVQEDLEEYFRPVKTSSALRFILIDD